MIQLSDFPPDVQALAKAAVDEMCKLHDYAGRPAWDAIVARTIMADRAGRLDLTGLTPRQADCLRFIHQHQAAHGGVSPSYDEIATGIGISSRGRVGLLIDQLEDRGRITRLPNRSRAITIISPPAS